MKLYIFQFTSRELPYVKGGFSAILPGHHMDKTWAGTMPVNRIGMVSYALYTVVNAACSFHIIFSPIKEKFKLAA